MIRFLILLGCSIAAEWFSEFHSLAEIHSWFHDMAKANQNRVEIVSNAENEKLFAIKIGNKFNGQRPSIVIDCGKYGSDWIAITSCQFIVHELVHSDTLFNYIIIPDKGLTYFQVKIIYQELVILEKDNFIIHSTSTIILSRENGHQVTPQSKHVT